MTILNDWHARDTVAYDKVRGILTLLHDAALRTISRRTSPRP